MNTVLIEAHPLVRTGIAHLLRTLKGVTGVTVVEPDDGMFDAIEANADAGLLVIGLMVRALRQQPASCVELPAFAWDADPATHQRVLEARVRATLSLSS